MHFIHFSLDFCESIVEFVEDIVDNNIGFGLCNLSHGFQID